MSDKRWKIAATPIVVAVMASPLMTNCSAINGAMGAAGLESPDCSEEFKSGDFSKLKANADLKGFFDASAKFTAAVNRMEVDLIASCGELGKALQMPAADLKAEPDGGKGAKKVCEAVAGKVSGILKASAGASLTIEITPPKCHADVDVMMKCFGDCGSPIKPGEIKASCQGGDISGSCSGKCEGSCKVDAGADCKGTCGGSCSGKCDASFSGTCGGKCDGNCDGKPAKGGKCAGKCEGKCDAQASGSCGGNCEGKCDATCEVKGQADCKGSCSGSCSVAMTAPKCSGEFKPPSVSVDCQAKCAAAGAASLTCDPPGVKIGVKGQASTDIQSLVTGLQAALPKIVKIQIGTAKALGTAGVGLVTSLKGAATGVSSAGIKAVGCMKAAVEGTVGASASIDINVKASASVGGAASGSASGGASGSAGGKTAP